MRKLLEIFEGSFVDLSSNSRALLDKTADEDLYKRPRDLPQTFAMFTIGEYLLRSAAAVERTFGGITTRLWDDPFEWTLPEKLATVVLVGEYLSEVDKTREVGFAFFESDDVLAKEIPAPSEIKSVATVLLETLARAEHYQGRAFAIFQMLSDEKLPSLR